ncbi:hypothetical protein KUTeg_008807 [Tegillarca granosa]|uniref:Uncharacterized protein n=1 Tax=Tegillarca granosa TaxID=220873 RepID=A0ABQ9FDE7_TEGGR|nr:hypothetical protein KUTeg_008807 [Tegillarca granosa]
MSGYKVQKFVGSSWLIVCSRLFNRHVVIVKLVEAFQSSHSFSKVCDKLFIAAGFRFVNCQSVLVKFVSEVLQRNNINFAEVRMMLNRLTKQASRYFSCSEKRIPALKS